MKFHQLVQWKFHIYKFSRDIENKIKGHHNLISS